MRKRISPDNLPTQQSMRAGLKVRKFRTSNREHKANKIRPILRSAA